MLTKLLRSLRGSNLEIFKFGLYLSFPIGWMYYFGTNLDERFSIPDFWPTQEQSHKLPYDRHDLKKEVERLQGQMRERKRAEALQAAQSRNLLEQQGGEGS
jgi:protein PET100, fungi type